MTDMKKRPLDSSSNGNLWERRTSLEKKLIVGLILALIAIIVISVLWATNSSRKEGEVCTSSVCITSAMELLDHVDLTEDPCDDFYRFSCGNFLKNTELNNRTFRSAQLVMEDEIGDQIRNILEEPLRAEDPEAYSLAKKFYRACKNETAIEAEGLKRVKQIFRQIGGWPTLEGNNWSDSRFDWKKVVLRLRDMGIQADWFLTVTLTRDDNYPDEYILEVVTPLYGASKNFEEMGFDNLRNFIEELSIIFGATPLNARRDSQETAQFIFNLAKLSTEAQEMNDTSSYFSILELQHKYPSLRLTEFINGFLKPTTTVTVDDKIKVEHPIYLKKLEIFLNAENPRVVANAISLITVLNLLGYLPTDIVNKAVEYEFMYHDYIATPRWKNCVFYTKYLLYPCVSTMYAERYYDEEIKPTVLSFTTEILREFKTYIRNLDWLDDMDKKKLVDRLEKAKTFVPTISDFRRQLEKYKGINELDIQEDKFLDAVLDMRKILAKKRFEEFRENTKDMNLGMVTSNVVTYSEKDNEIRFSIALTKGHYFEESRPEAFNYGTLGTEIASELAELLTDGGCSSRNFKIKDDWSPESKKNFEDKLKCFADQYNQFVVPEVGQHINGSSVKEDVLSSQMGKIVAYKAYQEWVRKHGEEITLPGVELTPEQIFWVSSVIPRCSKYSEETLEEQVVKYQDSPQQFSINGVLQNIPEFSSDFNCPLRSYMNPEEKCHV